MAKSRAKLRLKMAAIWLTQVARGELELKDYASLCGQLEKDASEDQQAHSSRQAARAAGDKQQGLKQLSRRTSEAAHGKTSAAARSSTEDATGAAPTAAAPPRDAPIVAALMTAKTESDVAQALDEAARTTAAATGMHAAPTKAAAEPKNYLVCAAAKPRRRQSRPRGRRGYGKRQWRRRQLEDSRNAEASAAKVKIEDRAVVRSAESGEAMVKHGVAAAAVVEDEQEADSRVTLRQLKQSIAELGGLVQATVLGADGGAIRHMARFSLDKSFASWRCQREHERAAAQQDFSVAKIMEKYKSRSAVAGWRQAVEYMAEAKEAMREATQSIKKFKSKMAVVGWQRAVGYMVEAKEVAEKEESAAQAWKDRAVRRCFGSQGWRSTAKKAREEHWLWLVKKSTGLKHEAGVKRCCARVTSRIAEIDKIAKKIKGRLSGAKAREFAEMVERARSAERRIMEARRNVASQSTVAELAHDEVCNRQSSMRRSCMHGVNVREVAECREQEEMKLRKCEQENEEAKVRAVNMRLEWAETLATYEEGAAGEKTAIASGSAVLPLVLAAGWLAFIMMIARSGVGPWALIATSAAVAGIATVALVLCKVTIWSLKAEEVSQESDFVAANVEQKTKRKPTARTLIGKDSMLRAQADLLDAKLKEVGLE